MEPAETPRSVDAEIIEQCYSRSVELLRCNSTSDGILAATRTERAAGRHYTSIFGRDAAICALGMVASGEADLIGTARAGLLTLAHHQAPNGQIPKFVKPETGDVDFWYSGCIDATLWWLIAIDFFERFNPGAGLKREVAPFVERALLWLGCQEHQVWRLLQQNEASDWADIMPRSGFVLYTNALWFWVKKLYDIPTAPFTRDYANHLFFPFGNAVSGHRRMRLLVHYIRNRVRRTECYLSFVNFSMWGEELDVFGNILAALTGLADSSRAGKIASSLLSLGVCHPHPVRVVGTPIGPDQPLWRLYMQRHRQNLPWQYHNGGSWPFVGGFWILLLTRLGMVQEAMRQLESLAHANRLNDWEFNEWLHGRTGKPMGMTGQSWNAALFILARRALADGTRFIP